MELKNLPKFEPKRKRDLLAESIENLKGTVSENEFYFLISNQLRGKSFKNRNNQLPNGRYEELEVNGSRDARRIIVDMDNFRIYATRDHYNTITYAGLPLWTE